MHTKLLKQSFYLIFPQKEAFAEAFYNRLFALYPQTKETDVTCQQTMQYEVA